MNAFEFTGPASIKQVLDALAGAKGGSADAEILAGGTDLLNRMKELVSSPSRVVSIQNVKELAGVTGDPAAGLVVGAGTKLADLVKHEGLRTAYPALHQAVKELGTPQIRNMATLGGNLVQRPRCWYYRNGYGLLGMKDGKSLVRTGENRYHAVFLTEGNALFVSPSSLAAALEALSAQVTIASAKGTRTIPIRDLYQVPKTEKDRELTIAPGELITKVTIPGIAGVKNGSYLVRHKQAHDWPLVMASVALGKTPKVILYGVAPIPWRSEAAEAALKNAGGDPEKITLAVAESVGKAATTGAAPLSGNGYKIPLIQTAVKRALLAAVGNRYWEA